MLPVLRPLNIAEIGLQFLRKTFLCSVLRDAQFNTLDVPPHHVIGRLSGKPCESFHVRFVT